MLFRLIVIFVCVIVFINGCNSLISQFAGTHKLRTYDMETVVAEGLGDADYVEINNAWTTGDFIYAPPVRSQKKGLIIFPILSDHQIQQWDNGQEVEVKLMGWSEDYTQECLDANNCMPRKQMTLRGIIRDIPSEKDKSAEFAKAQYELHENMFFIEKDRSPLAWYFNLGLMAAALLVGFGLEYYNLKKSKANSNE
ncbi:MAG: hypothetical protein MRY78_18570 [Saprospiraceae bacterium]|nr:hypothetical protein [Saprospiraceae bacterium]